MLLRLNACLLLGWLLAAPVHAGLFADDDARLKIELLESRIVTMEETLKQQTDASRESMMNLQGQLEALTSQLRVIRGKNEEFAHGLQDAKKRQRDFYIDLDSRLRNLESGSGGVVPPAISLNPDTAAHDPDNPAPENRAYEKGYGLFKSGSHVDAVKAFREFINQFPKSVHVQNAYYWLGQSKIVLKDYMGAQSTYELLLKNFPDFHKAADAYFSLAESKNGLNLKDEAKITLQQLVDKYPGSGAAAKAKKLLGIK
ncbi:MAG: tol-pal system protein YbgF [Gallionella sp.]